MRRTNLTAGRRTRTVLAVDGVRGSLSDLGGELASEKATAVGHATSSVATAARSVFDTLGDR